MLGRKTSIAEVADLLVKPFTRAELGRVDDYAAYLSRFDGVWKFHEHPYDEMYIVLEGEIFIDYYDGPSVPVRHREVLVVEAGDRHRSRAEEDSLVLMFKTAYPFAE